MTQDSKSGRDRVLRFMLNNLSQFTSVMDRGERDDDEEPDLGSHRTDQQRMDFSTARELIGALASWAGKGKDEVVQTLCREIGQAVAAVLKEPLNQVLENKKLQFTIEFVPKKNEEPHAPMPPPRKKVPRRKRPKPTP